MFVRVNFREDEKKKYMRREKFLVGVWLKGEEEKKNVVGPSPRAHQKFFSPKLGENRGRECDLLDGQKCLQAFLGNVGLLFIYLFSFLLLF